MNPLTIIIPSRNIKNLRACVTALRRAGEVGSIIVIWDAPKTGDQGVRDLWLVQNTLNEVDPLFASIVLRGETPFIFARNCNIGIKAAGQGADVVLLNDDALLETPAGFSAMQMAADADPALSLVSATTNIANNPAQICALLPDSGRVLPYAVRIARQSPGLSFPAVAFVCVLIPAQTIEAIGFLDERYTAYGWEDTDYCRRIFDGGGKIGIHDGCFVDHSKLTSTFRGDPRAPGPIEEGRRIYIEKWGKL